MKIVILNTAERKGGAAVAANRLLKALSVIPDTEVTMLVRDKDTDNPQVLSVNTSTYRKRLNKIRFIWERGVIYMANHFDRSRLFQVSIANTGTDVSRHPAVREADIIHLHWINQGFLSLRDLHALQRLGKPIVWTLHDLWPATGICHYAYTCEAYRTHCGACPFLHSHCKTDLAYRIFNKKKIFFKTVCNLHIVTVSSWLQRIVQQSSLTRHIPCSTIPNSLDASLFTPSDKAAARATFGFPTKAKIILMGAANLNAPIKGLETLYAALRLLSGTLSPDTGYLVLFGAAPKQTIAPDLPFTCRHLGLLQNPQTIARLYAAADVTVVPSHYETFGQTLTEAMACGCPVVSFDNSGQTDIIDHQQNGYLARYQDSQDLSDGIAWVLNHPEPETLKQACLAKVNTCYRNDVVARQYHALYQTLLKQK